MGLIPLALILGAQASHVGQSPLTTMLMTGLNVAGGSEFAALGLWSAAPPIIMIAFTTFLINSRHIVLSMALAPYVREQKGWRIGLLYFFMVDEVWALNMQDLSRRAQRGEGFSFAFYMTLGISLWLAWVLSAFIGCIIGSSFGDLSSFGFTAALPATFIALAVAMRPRARLRTLNLIAYVPIAASFTASALTQLYGNSNYCVGAGISAGVITALVIQLLRERAQGQHPSMTSTPASGVTSGSASASASDVAGAQARAQTAAGASAGAGAETAATCAKTVASLYADTKAEEAQDNSSHKYGPAQAVASEAGADEAAEQLAPAAGHAASASDKTTAADAGAK
nr:AzlC family ABC transporter permease [Anaerobiospirillum sp. NML120449]